VCPAPEDPQHTHPWRDTVKREVREEQAKEVVVLCGPYSPSPKLLEGIHVPLVWVQLCV
jgi:hypothetical protein